MRKKIILIIGIMLLSIVMFGCSNNDIKTPDTLELKDEYKKDVSEEYIKSFNECTSYAIKLYKNIDNTTEEDIKRMQNLTATLLESKSGSELSESEMLIGKKITDVNSEMVSYYLGSDKKETKAKLKTNMQSLLDLYK
ncbi:hypothetical protein KTC92_02510 [Clostridium sp. CM027]|uniref:hypothetical protein n=1 Tax=Clostridium sp. CM027 TaxID=2849865 RepID=UPI001C6F0858|nr:hypothetical protein [Clostridium sp. CM027]MBW9147297.1 hypothetical protein [Clostridium sp. CM027]UVE41389.1 hypothetical protein KTC92_02510 [Clostridium sp. CM027]